MMASFKKPKCAIRRRQTSFSSEEEDEDTEAVRSTLEEVKQMQRLRRRQRGVNVEDLAVGEIKEKEDKGKADPLKIKTGGYVDLKTLKKELANSEDIEQIGTTFAAETNRRDEDADMLQYVETELAKHKGIQEDHETTNTGPKNPLDALYELPEHIKNITSSTKKSEDMLSNQMLSGIPELDLGIEQKIRNIEQTEEAKQKLLAERQKKKDAGISNFVPTNMAVNFVQHNRFNIDDNTPTIKRVQPAPKPAPLRVGDIEKQPSLQEQQKRKKGIEKATDDLYFERFKKQLRRY